MATTKAVKNQDAEVDMTPMLDIVFIMLIFFIVTTSFVREQGLVVERPANNQSTDKPKSKPIFIEIAADGTIFINQRISDINRVTANVQSMLAEHNSKQILVDAATNTSHQLVMQVMDQAQTAAQLPIALVSKVE